MKGRNNKLLIAIVIIVMAGAAGLVHAAPANQQIISKQEAIQKAQHQQKGRVISIKLYQKKGKPPVYRVKILQNGDVHQLSIDARARK